MKKFTSADLKLIAMTTMFIDHVGAILIEKSSLYEIGGFQMLDFILRQIGRISFPLYCFLLVEAFFFTRDRKKYALRVLGLAFLSELQYDMAFSFGWNTGRNNVLFTLVLGFMMIWGLSKLEEKYEGKKLLVMSILPVAVTCGISMILHSSYTYMGILIIALLYLLRRDNKLKCILSALVLARTPMASVGFLCAYHYNGEKGKMKIPGWFYQWFYPVHILFLWLVRVAFL